MIAIDVHPVEVLVVELERGICRHRAVQKNRPGADLRAELLGDVLVDDVHVGLRLRYRAAVDGAGPVLHEDPGIEEVHPDRLHAPHDVSGELAAPHTDLGTYGMLRQCLQQELARREPDAEATAYGHGEARHRALDRPRFRHCVVPGGCPGRETLRAAERAPDHSQHPCAVHRHRSSGAGHPSRGCRQTKTPDSVPISNRPWAAISAVTTRRTSSISSSQSAPGGKSGSYSSLQLATKGTDRSWWLRHPRLGPTS